MMTQVLVKVAGIFLMLAVGALARYRKVITDEALDSLCKVVLYVTLPFLFIYILSTKCLGDTILSLWMGPVAAVLIIGAGFAISSILALALKLPPKKRDAFKFLITFQNCGFIAIPLALALFGEEAVVALIIFNIGFNLLYWTFGVWLLSRSGAPNKENIFKNLINTSIGALILGTILGIFCIKLPTFVLDASKILGNATIPLAMLVVGAILASAKFQKGANVKEIFCMVLGRLVLVPLIFLGLVKYFGNIPPLMQSVIVLQACMPSASSSPIMAKRFGGDYDFAASGVFYTTLFSIITIPIFMGLI